MAKTQYVCMSNTIILDRRLALGESEEIIAAEMDALVAGGRYHSSRLVASSAAMEPTVMLFT